MITREDVFRIGRFYKPHGIAGELTFAFDDDVFDRTQSPCWLVDMDGILVPFFWESYRFRTDTTALVKLEGVDNEREAKELSDREVYYPKAYADTDQDEMPLEWRQLVGFRLVNTADGQETGRVKSVDDSTLNVLLDVERPDGGSCLLPAAEELIENVDVRERTLYMSVPEGLLNLADNDTV